MNVGRTGDVDATPISSVTLNVTLILLMDEGLLSIFQRGPLVRPDIITTATCSHPSCSKIDLNSILTALYRYYIDNNQLLSVSISYPGLQPLCHNILLLSSMSSWKENYDRMI